MPTYDYKCRECDGVFELTKPMKDPHPSGCPLCHRDGCVDRIFHATNVTYANRPAWTYNDFKHYKTSSHNGGPRFKMDPSKVGDLASWNNPGDVAAPTETDVQRAQKKKKILNQGGYMKDADKAVYGE